MTRTDQLVRHSYLAHESQRLSVRTCVGYFFGYAKIPSRASAKSLMPIACFAVCVLSFAGAAGRTGQCVGNGKLVRIPVVLLVNYGSKNS